jgi:hypothetical protein
MSKKNMGTARTMPNKFKTVKTFEGTKIVVHTEILARTHDGHCISDNTLPEGLKCIIICKIAMLEIEIETMIDNYLKRNHHGKL